MAEMSDRNPGPPTETEGRSLQIRIPPDERFRIVVETALRIYLRPICRGPETAPKLSGELAAMIDEVAGSGPLEVEFSCRQPALEITVRCGRRRRSRRWEIAPEG
jgi:hypothetical protein